MIPQPLLRRPAAMPLIVSWIRRAAPVRRLAGAMAAAAVDLHMVQRVEIRKAVADDRASSGLPCSSRSWPVIASNASIEALPFAANAREDLPRSSSSSTSRRSARRWRCRSWPAPCPCWTAAVRKNGHSRYISRSSARPVAGSFASQASTAAPKPYQPGSISRHCAQLNTQGIARRSSIRRDVVREAGRLPMFSVAISLIGVDSAEIVAQSRRVS